MEQAEINYWVIITVILSSDQRWHRIWHLFIQCVINIVMLMLRLHVCMLAAFRGMEVVSGTIGQVFSFPNFCLFLEAMDKKITNIKKT